MRFVFVLLILVGLSFLHQPGAFADEKAVLKTISYEREKEGAEIVQFQLNGAHIPKIFMLTGKKPRLVVDFLNTHYRGESSLGAEEAALVKGIRIGKHDKPQMKTRVVIDLTRSQPITWEQDFILHQNRLVISLTAGSDVATEDQREETAPEKTSHKEKKDVSSGAQDDATGSEPSKSDSAERQETPLVAKTIPALRYNTNEIGRVKPGSASDIPVLLDVSFDNSTEKGEMILFKLDDFHPPVVSAIEKGTPRIVCDFYNMRISGEISPVMDVDGEYIKKVRVARHENPGKVRAVLDLVPGHDYDLQQVFFNEDNLFVLIVNILGSEEGAAKPQ